MNLKPLEITHPGRGRCEDVVATSFCSSQQCCRYVSNETHNDVSVKRCRDISVVRLQDVIKERRDNFLRVSSNDVPLVLLKLVSNET